MSARFLCGGGKEIISAKAALRIVDIGAFLW
jgi:hypothetical protein